jgi:leucyl-tRNA synthetase
MTQNKKYNHLEIEPKWQQYWLKNKTFKSEVDPSKPKYYVLDMFPFPSGSGLHVGHPEGYTATDILARYKRNKGFNVLHPMGWDSFGLPAEQYAVRTGTHPAETTRINVDNFRRQLQALGFSYDWDREFATSDPDVYKWTQWIFTKLYERGLAYEANVQVNYCAGLGTVLANEEIENGLSKVGGHPVEKKSLRQWMLKITAYADRLIEDLALVDWPEGLKRLQINWIGKSQGAQVQFRVKDRAETISVFTTRPDTLFGATYVVLAPEHPFVKSLTTKEQQAAVEAYCQATARKSDMDRTEVNPEKTGVFTGSYAINPVNDEAIPIWIADYVLASYGTGAVMAVPAHDPRDYDMAKKFNLPIIPVFEPDAKASPECIPEGMAAESVKDAVLAGQLCWPGDGKAINSAHETLNFNGQNTADSKETVINWLEANGRGKRTISYKLRDWLFSRQRYWGEPFPVIHLEDGTLRCLDVDELPLLLPDLQDFKPAGDGQSPLAKVTDWLEITDPKTGKKGRRETNTMPNWAGSCWYYLRFIDPHNDVEAWSPEKEAYWLPVDMYIGGVEHAVLHLLYARFWHKVLYDCGYVTTPEPFKTLRNQGLITARSFQTQSGSYVETKDVYEKNGEYFHRETHEKLRTQIEKMSKSKLNGVTPDEVVAEYGADSLRLYEMFMGPLDREKVWNTDAVSGCRRFLSRVYDLLQSGKIVDEENEEANRLINRVVNSVGKDIESLQFNTAIAKMMEFMNDFTKLEKYPRSAIKKLIIILNPFAPHICEELWQQLGCKEELTYHAWPEVDVKYLVDDVVTLVVQINGKVRARLDVEKDCVEAEAMRLASQEPNIQRHLDGQKINKVIFVPNRLLNIVI